ncbi:hypothetical protein LI99_02465 [Mycolicibacterium smegmatis]|uniref:Uncharacterized protein n=1 Tax=Mycolicibacterium smegmatis (strain ATCC 700084 / mc(2)155) TaxID=246196 RepID=A0QPS2_MYCS2|nr:hypothetical protein MSMEG_0498 [Mycolicibacterium smegmatis MC2 155]AIU12393.1 hypothetical protein LI99_02465 [Mycolicibacterium smegmatis]AIU05768.1 hypothetical protein LJ00_02465 [Mycolicibacterium smegmatis MC2 155]AIU19017.1 hypothetical protein LI98_02465 [Mycolicibacterium smegmatis]TBH33247.1 hypothetical protein EYS45_22315 [Mycolicibacterium smegmatis MC2 155]
MVLLCQRDRDRRPRQIPGNLARRNAAAARGERRFPTSC